VKSSMPSLTTWFNHSVGINGERSPRLVWGALSPSNHGAHNRETSESEAELADHSRF